MAAYPFRMSRSGRARLAAGVMILLVLAAGVLFSAGSAHHRHGHHAAGGHRAAVVQAACDSPAETDRAGQVHRTGQAPGHEHEHGNEWTPHLTPRARPVGHATLVGVVGVHREALCPGSAVAGSDLTLSLLGVLRV